MVFYLFRGIKVGRGGLREIFFVLRSKVKYKEDEEDNDLRRNKRGVYLLGFTFINYEMRSRGRGRGRGRGNRGRGRGRGRY